MYFKDTKASNCAEAGDRLFICLLPDCTVLAVIAKGGCTICNQLLWLFGLPNESVSIFSVRENLKGDQERLAYASHFILEQIGIKIEAEPVNYLEDMKERFGTEFPCTALFSEYARSTLSFDPLGNPDDIILCFMEREEALFRAFEVLVMKEAHINRFGDRAFHTIDIDHSAMSDFYLTFQNRRKSRVGLSLENHVEFILKQNDIKHDRSKITESNNKPDFIFPGIKEYHDPSFSVSLLTMLGVKHTCKDRWRQILNEASKIKIKHLLTLDVAISENQINQMIEADIQLVVPTSNQSSYPKNYQNQLMSFSDFIQLVRQHQT
jgi:hypothetical protein